jgi:hypothetical protein
MSKVDTYGPAFPTSVAFHPDADFGNGMIVTGDKGMTLRDWFAGQIAAGMAAHSGTMGMPFGPEQIAKRAYEIAYAMLAERAKGGAA